MPWKVFKVGDEFCVHKIDAEAKRVGASLGCHATMDSADKQLAALNANIKEADLVIAAFHERVAVDEIVKEGKLAPGSVWDITILKVGKSLSPPHYFYSQEALDKATKIFEGANVYANRAAPHVDPKNKSVHDAVGWISAVSTTSGALVGRLNILPSADWLRMNLLAAYTHGKLNLYELSIDAGGRASQREVEIDGKREMLPYVESIDHVEGVDIVPKGAAGGAINKLVASYQGGRTMREQLLTLLNELAPKFLEENKVDQEKVTEEQLLAHFKEAFTGANDAVKQAADAQLVKMKEELKAKDDKKKDDDGLQKRLDELEKRNCASLLEASLANSKLPVPLQEDLRKRFGGKVFDEADLTEGIKSTRETYAKFVQDIPNNHGLDVHVGLEGTEKVQLGIDGFFLGAEAGGKGVMNEKDLKEACKGIPPFKSFKEAYVQLTGDVEISGQASRSRMQEAIDTTQFAQVVADALNKRMVRDYVMLNLMGWKLFTDIVSVSDFKTQHRIRVGGYPNIPAVTQGAAYAPLTSPVDEEATYAATKRGGTEEITREAIMNDDVGAIQKIPGRLARAAGQTLHEFVFALVDPSVNATIYNGQVLYHADHNNTATTALGNDGVALAAARLRMKKQTQDGSAKRLGLRARYLVVPPDREEDAYDNLTPAFNKSNTVPEYYQQLGIVPIVVDYWTDVTDWALIADKSDLSGLEIGFVGGKQNPELFVSDLANVGSWFTNDKITYKIRHEYSGAITDFRAFDGSVVA